MSNTFNGVLYEFPFLGVDCFNTTASVFLLTHCHTDHLTGLTNKSSTGVIYASKETKLLLEANDKLAKYTRRIKVLPYCTRTRLELPIDNCRAIYVTTIQSYHCLGSCMFLIEEFDLSNESCYDSQTFEMCATRLKQAVLCTGDVKAEQWWCGSLANVPQLQPYLAGYLKLNNIYFDSTFAYRGEPYIEMPPNNQGIYTAILMLKEYPLLDPEIHYQLRDTTLGFEEVWSFIFNFFGGSLKVFDESLLKKLLVVAEHDQTNGRTLAATLDCKAQPKRGPTFYCGSSCPENKVKVSLKQCINFNVRDYVGICFPIELSSLPQDEVLELELTTALGNKVYNLRDRQWILPKHGKYLLPLEIKYVFSRHSSFTEMHHLISLLKPLQVFPCFYSYESWRNGFCMSRLFGDVCSGNHFLFDELMSRHFDHPPNFISNHPVATINRWSISECDAENRIVQEILDRWARYGSKAALKTPHLLEIRKVARFPLPKSTRATKNVQQLSKRRGEFALQKLMEEKGKLHFERFIRERQMEYYEKSKTQKYQRGYEQPRYCFGKSNSFLGGSSYYDSDSEASSFDLVQKVSSISGKLKSESISSFVPDSCQYDSESNLSKTSLNSLSFIESSFASFEESVNPRHTSASDYVKSIDSRARILAHRPWNWHSYELSCTK